MLVYLKLDDTTGEATGRHDIGGPVSVITGLDLINAVRLGYKYMYFRVRGVTLERPDFAVSLIRPYTVVRAYVKPPRNPQ